MKLVLRDRSHPCTGSLSIATELAFFGYRQRLTATQTSGREVDEVNTVRTMQVSRTLRSRESFAGIAGVLNCRLYICEHFPVRNDKPCIRVRPE